MLVEGSLPHVEFPAVGSDHGRWAMARTSISFKVPEKLLCAFRDQSDALFLKFAPFLDYLIRRELVHLQEDLADLRLSTRAKRYISGQLKRNDLKSVSIDVMPETAAALREAVADHNLVRDAFICR